MIINGQAIDEINVCFLRKIDAMAMIPPGNKWLDAIWFGQDISNFMGPETDGFKNWPIHEK